MSPVPARVDSAEAWKVDTHTHTHATLSCDTSVIPGQRKHLHHLPAILPVSVKDADKASVCVRPRGCPVSASFATSARLDTRARGTHTRHSWSKASSVRIDKLSAGHRLGQSKPDLRAVAPYAIGKVALCVGPSVKCP